MRPDHPQSDFLPKIRAYIGKRIQAADNDLHTEVRPIRGGLDSTGVSQVRVQTQVEGRNQRFSLVVKRLPRHRSAEADAYEHLQGADELAPRLFGVERDEEEVRLYLEFVRRAHAWPWHDIELSAEVMRRLIRAQQHLREALAGASPTQSWDYDSELRSAGRNLLRLMENPQARQLSCVRESLTSVKKLVEDLDRIREELMNHKPFGRSPIHGDAHSGNVVVRRRRGRLAPVLLDWGRMRQGSSLEDVSSWLQSLGYWEPQVKRRHDTLLSLFLSESGYDSGLTRSLRDAYWLAAASTVLAGAAEYHIACATFAPHLSERQRTAAESAAADSLRVLRRAGACWR